MPSTAEKYYFNKMRKMKDFEKRNLVRPDFDSEKIKNVHLIGICGKAMASLAGLFIELGCRVSGSDKDCYPPMKDVLDELSIESKKYSKENIKDADLVIVGNVCTPTFEEVEAVIESGKPFLSAAEAISRFFIENKRSIVASGTHGKTTTTSMLTHIFQTANLNPAFMVGGVMQNTHTSYSMGENNTKHFIIEGDEYDTAFFDKGPKFLHYKPYQAIITSVEFDHADIFEDLTDYRKAFYFLCSNMKTGNRIIIFDEIENYDEIVKDSEAEILTYGFKESSFIYAKNIIVKEEGQSFDLVRDGVEYNGLFLPMSGSYNLLNSLAVIEAALAEGIDFEVIKKGLKSFKSVKKRQEVLADINDILIIDDFAHHPTAVEQTLKGIKERYPNRRVIAVFEPKSASSRSKLFENRYLKSFSNSDLVFIKALYPETEKSENNEVFDSYSVTEQLTKNKNTLAYAFIDLKEMEDKIINSIKQNDVVVIMSNGDFGNIHQKIINRLK